MMNLPSQQLFFRGENTAYEFIEAILKEFEYCKKVMKKHFNKNLIMSEEEGEQFKSSNTRQICEKLIIFTKVENLEVQHKSSID